MPARAWRKDCNICASSTRARGATDAARPPSDTPSGTRAIHGTPRTIDRQRHRCCTSVRSEPARVVKPRRKLVLSTCAPPAAPAPEPWTTGATSHRRRPRHTKASRTTTSSPRSLPASPARGASVSAGPPSPLTSPHWSSRASVPRVRPARKRNARRARLSARAPTPERAESRWASAASSAAASRGPSSGRAARGAHALRGCAGALGPPSAERLGSRAGPPRAAAAAAPGQALRRAPRANPSRWAFFWATAAGPRSGLSSAA
eukprot:9503992-Pyramimonas_sp.AAC.3